MTYSPPLFNSSHQAAAQKAPDSDSLMSPEVSPVGPHLDLMEERRRSQALVGVADVEANLSEEKLLQADGTESSKVRRVFLTASVCLNKDGGDSHFKT